VRFRGGGHKQTYRLVDFKRRNTLTAKVERLEYDPNRSAFHRADHLHGRRAVLHHRAAALSVGDEVVAGLNVDVKPGNAMPLANIPSAPSCTTSS